MCLVLPHAQDGSASVFRKLQQLGVGLCTGYANYHAAQQASQGELKRVDVQDAELPSFEDDLDKLEWLQMSKVAVCPAARALS